MRKPPTPLPLREKLLYQFGVRNADKIICQTEYQKEMLHNDFDREAEVVRMPSAGFVRAIQEDENVNKPRKHILWVGRFSEEKRLEYFLEVAQLLPELTFDVVGDSNFDNDNYADNLKEWANRIPNVVLHGRVPHEELGVFFASSLLLCSTSVYEGFPNTYLEAWSVGLPVVTTFDPDSVVANYGLGRSVVDVAGIERAINELLEYDQWKIASSAAESYYVKHHTLAASMSHFEIIFARIAGSD
jgi:glycosyltransferase involved in cell wall biosynthesis